LVEIYQNCPIFNDGAFDVLKEQGERERRIIPLTDGEPIVFGAEGEFGVVRDPATGSLTVRKVAEVGTDAVVVHDASAYDPSQAFALSRLTGSDLAHTVTGVFRSVSRPTYDDQARAQVEQAKSAKPADLQALLRGNDAWSVAG
jgi:2-oxoglutarate ferredoxin oxidoreductase subunit beta